MQRYSDPATCVDLLAIRLGGVPSEIRLSMKMCGRYVVRDGPIYGWQYTADVSRPFVIDFEGRLDFGTLYDLHQYGETDLLQVEIAVGSKIAWDCHGSDDIYVIRSITKVPKLDARQVAP